MNEVCSPETRWRYKEQEEILKLLDSLYLKPGKQDTYATEVVDSAKREICDALQAMYGALTVHYWDQWEAAMIRCRLLPKSGFDYERDYAVDVDDASFSDEEIDAAMQDEPFRRCMSQFWCLVGYPQNEEIHAKMLKDNAHIYLWFKLHHPKAVA